MNDKRGVASVVIMLDVESFNSMLGCLRSKRINPIIWMIGNHCYSTSVLLRYNAQIRINFSAPLTPRGCVFFNKDTVPAFNDLQTGPLVWLNLDSMSMGH
jgi:hypothetical protein